MSAYKLFRALLLALCLTVSWGSATAWRTASPEPILSIREAELPPEARATIALIRQGGPFPFRRDGVVFQNREARLPARPSGYYHEYTVPTPAAHDRGARRLINGQTEEFYYSADHYRSFRRVLP